MKNILITGSTDGIGKLAAIQIARQGHRVFLHGRKQEKLEAVITEVKSVSKNENILGFVADFSDLDAVKHMAEDIKKQVGHIDVLINNAGIFFSSQSHNKDGYDLRFTVNYLASYLLTKELLPLLSNGVDSRIINLSSAAQSTISYDAMLGKEGVYVGDSYAQSKLAVTMWSMYLAAQLKDIVVIAVNPGSLLNTKLANKAYGKHWSPAEKGSDILCELALSDKHKVNTGKYFDNDSGVYADAHPDAYNQKSIDELIKFSEQLVLNKI